VARPRQAEPGSLEATGERLVPGLQHGELVHAEHLARYRLAAQLAPGRQVLDAASGEGYGSAILKAAGARRVVGVDLDPKTAEHARRHHDAEFVVGDVAELPFEEDSFDLVVSFETIEHVAEPSKALAEFRRVLVPDGIFLVSTPNKDQYLVENEFHTIEFTHEEFVSLLREQFETVEVLLQHNWLASAVLSQPVAADSDGQAAHEVSLFKVAGIEAGKELYSLAACGPVPPLRPVVVTAGTDEAHQLAVRLSSAERSAEQWHGEYVEATSTAERWHGEFLAAKQLAEELRGAYDSTAAALDTVYRSRSWRLLEPFRRAARLIRRG
jgi:ubiquinone/menaquinone biosynthesis C-methylase UbiE